MSHCMQYFLDTFMIQLETFFFDEGSGIISLWGSCGVEGPLSEYTKELFRLNGHAH